MPKKTKSKNSKKRSSSSKTKKKSTKRPSVKKSTKRSSAKKKTQRTTRSKNKTNMTKSTQGITQIKVIGVGGGGGNIISRMKDDHRIRGVEYVAINTDAQDLDYASAHKKIYIGKSLTRGLGAGMDPNIGRRAAEENKSEIEELFDDADIVFIAAGMGGGTGSGAAPVIAEAAKEKGKIVVAIVTKPFHFEGTKRMNIATEAINQLRENVDSIVVVPNERVFSVIDKDTPIMKAFSYVDNVVIHGVKAIAELINVPGIINVDFADIRSVLTDAGQSLIGVGEAKGQDRGSKAVNEAINSPLLEASVEGARGVLLSIGGGRDLKMSEVNDIAKTIVANLDANAQVIFGAYHEKPLKKNSVKVTVIATGFNGVSGNGSVIPRLFDDMNKDEERENTQNGKLNENDKDQDQDEEAPKPKIKSPSSGSDDPWDIPAFLRKKKK